jgi:electron transfer flavoprotein alpha subunit
METILLLANSEANGALAQSALEALGASKALAADMPGSKLVVGLVGQTVQPAANRIAACGAQTFLGVEGADFAASRYASDAAAAEAIAKAAHATVILAPATSRWNRAGSSPAAGGTRGYARYRSFRQRREAVGQPLVLSSAHGGSAAPQPKALVNPDRSRQPARLAR